MSPCVLASLFCFLTAATTWIHIYISFPCNFDLYVTHDNSRYISAVIVEHALDRWFSKKEAKAKKKVLVDIDEGTDRRMQKGVDEEKCNK